MAKSSGSHEEVYTVTYEFKNHKDKDVSGYRGFLPTKIKKNISFIELGNQVVNILNNKGVDIEDLKIYHQNSQIVIEIYFNTDSRIYNVELSPDLQTLYDQFNKQKNGLDILKSKTPMGHNRQEAIIQLMKMFLKKSRGRDEDDKIVVTRKTHTLLLSNYHNDVPKKTIQNLKFFFISQNKGSTKYSTLIPQGLELSKLKQSLNIDEDNLFYSILNIFMDFPFTTIIERDGQKLQEYIHSQGYNEGELLDIKYMVTNQGYDAYVFIYMGQKLNLYNITFSFENMESMALMEQLSQLKKKLNQDEDMMDNDYIPEYLDTLLKQKIKQPFEIKKTINEISHPKKGYNVNFHVKVALENFFIENIYFINNKDANLYKAIKSKIGYHFSEKILKKDQSLLADKLEEKVEYNVEKGSLKNGKIIIFSIGEPFDINNILSKFKPSFGLNFSGINISKKFEHKLYWGPLFFPISWSFQFHKKDKENYNIDGRWEMNINKTIFHYLKKREKNLSQFNLVAGFTYVIKKPNQWANINKKFLGFSFGSNNHQKYKKKFYYKNTLDILYYFSENKNTLLSKNNFFINGFNYCYRLSLGKENLIKLDDSGDVNLILQDKINSNWYGFGVANPLLNCNINYATGFLTDGFFQNTFQWLWMKSHPSHSKYEEKDLNIITKKYTDSDTDKFVLGFTNFLVVGNNLYKINVFIGYKLMIMVGYFVHSAFLFDEKNSMDYKHYTGINISFKISFGVLNLYFPVFCKEKNDIFTATKLVDFSLESANGSIKNQKNKFIYKSSMPLDKNFLE
jgi:hypothetical protein